MIYLIRHGETDGGQKGETPLNEHGFNQARQTAPDVKGLGITQIYSSDVLRAVQTTKEINKVVNVPVVFDKRLREFPILARIKGKFEDLPPKEIEKALHEAFVRVQDFLAEIKGKKNIAIVTHRGIILTMMYIKEYGEFDMEKVTEFRKKMKTDIKNCEIIRFEI